MVAVFLAKDASGSKDVRLVVVIGVGGGGRAGRPEMRLGLSYLKIILNCPLTSRAPKKFVVEVQLHGG